MFRSVHTLVALTVIAAAACKQSPPDSSAEISQAKPGPATPAKAGEANAKAKKAGTTDDKPDPKAIVSRLVPTTKNTGADMRSHFQRASVLHAAVISGDGLTLQDAVAAFSGRPPLDTQATPPSWKPHLEALRKAESRATDASNELDLELDEDLSRPVGELASAMGDIAVACGSCHRAHGITPTVSTATPVTADTSAHMVSHQVAADLMWQSLLRHDETEWNRAAGLLSKVSMCPESSRDYPALPEGAAKDAAQLHELARSGLKASTMAQRGQVYGKLLATCASCHTSGC